MALNRLKIIQHNVIKWTFNRSNECANLYIREDPDIILLNSTGLADANRIKIFNYHIYQKNESNEENSGIAIAIRKNLKYQLLDDFQGDLLGVKLHTTRGPIVILTTYLPPRRNFIPIADFTRELQKPLMTYILGDLNARHRMFDYRSTNNTGIEIANLINNNLCKHMGPDFSTLINMKGRPDILLGNKEAVLYYRLTEGPLTTSDHIPLILELSTTLIMVRIPPCLKLRKTNWDNFKNQVDEIMQSNENEIKNKTRIDKDVIDNYIERWMGTIQEKIKANTPTSEYRIYPNIRESDELRWIATQYNRLRYQTNSWTRDQIQHIKELQRRLYNETNELIHENWDSVIYNLDDIYNRPDKFWKRVKVLKGNNAQPIPYIKNYRNEKITDENEVIELFHSYWQKIFQINPEENVDFDMDNEVRVNNYLNENQMRIQTYSFADLNRLENPKKYKP